MSPRAQELSKRIEAFRDEVIAFVNSLSGEEWKAVCDAEDWSVGTTAYHLGAGHLAIKGMLGMIIAGQALPDLTTDQVNAMSDKSAREHADATPAEALAKLRQNGKDLAVYVAGLSDEELDRKGSMRAFGGEASVNQVIDYIIFQSGRQHLASMKLALGR
jgi:hypothetical protein